MKIKEELLRLIYEASLVDDRVGTIDTSKIEAAVNAGKPWRSGVEEEVTNVMGAVIDRAWALGFKDALRYFAED